MTLAEFRETLGDARPPNASPALIALWHDARGDWHAAHHIAQDIDDETGAWIHAYLHRREGDLANAGYWYRRARRPPADGPLDREWQELVESIVASA